MNEFSILNIIIKQFKKKKKREIIKIFFDHTLHYTSNIKKYFRKEEEGRGSGGRKQEPTQQ